MKILAIEFSSVRRSVAVIEATVGSAPKALGNASEMGGRRALALVDQALQQAGLEREQIDCIAVGIGPGSYMGIRGAIALAQGWQLARGAKLLGISSVDVLAATAQRAGLCGSVAIAIDAQRNEFYLAHYDISPERCREVRALRLAAFTEVQQLLQNGQLMLGPELNHGLPMAKNLFPDAVQLGMIAATRDDFISGEKLEPIYLREAAFKKAPPLRVID